MNYRIERASQAFGKFENRAWSDFNLSLKTKTGIYKTVVLTIFSYSSETWSTYRRHNLFLERFHEKSLRRLVNINWQSYTADTKVLQRTNVASIEKLPICNQIRWTGHLTRMQYGRFPKIHFYRELLEGNRLALLLCVQGVGDHNSPTLPL